jgi:hypothetical protein
LGADRSREVPGLRPRGSRLKPLLQRLAANGRVSTGRGVECEKASVPNPAVRDALPPRLSAEPRVRDAVRRLGTPGSGFSRDALANRACCATTWLAAGKGFR